MFTAIPIPLSVRVHGNVEKSFEGEYEVAGTRGQSLGIEQFRVDRVPVPSMTLYYSAHTQDVGNVTVVHQGEWIGSSGEDLIGFSASLEGPDARKVETHVSYAAF